MPKQLTKTILLLSCILWLYNATAQSFTSDIDLIQQINFNVDSLHQYYKGTNNANIMKTKHSNGFAKYNPLSLSLKSAMFLYQNVITKQLSKACPYEITCSNFAKQSIQQFGIIKGLFMGADRLLRCNRLSILDVFPLDFNVENNKIQDFPNTYQ